MKKKMIFLLMFIMAFALFTSTAVWADSVGNCVVKDKKGSTQNMKIYVKGDLTMTEVNANGQIVKSVVDKKSGTITTIMDTQKMCMTMKNPNPSSSIKPEQKEAKSAEGEYKCEWKTENVDPSKLACPTGYNNIKR